MLGSRSNRQSPWLPGSAWLLPRQSLGDLYPGHGHWRNSEHDRYGACPSVASIVRRRTERACCARLARVGIYGLWLRWRRRQEMPGALEAGVQDGASPAMFPALPSGLTAGEVATSSRWSASCRLTHAAPPLAAW